MPIQHESERFTYIRHADCDVHEFVFHQANRLAVDEFLVVLDPILSQAPNDRPLRVLVDLRPDGLPPINYVFPRLKAFFQKRYVFGFRVVYLYDSSTLLSMIQSFLNLLRQKTERRFMTDREAALAWLRGDESAP